MSWDISWVDENGDCYNMPESFEEGGTITIGGTTKTTLNVTYNYGELYNFKMLDRRDFDECVVEILEFLRNPLWGNSEKYSDYWAPTPGNVKHALSILYSFMREFPKGRFEVT
jgi:hypothetical protein